MTESDPRTQALITRLEQGDEQAAAELLPLVYERLRGLAQAFLSKRSPDAMMQATGLVHEAYLQLAGNRERDWSGKTHFLSVAAKAMRNLVVDHSRREQAEKRGGDWQRLTSVDLIDDGAQIDLDVLALHEALERLAELDPRAAEIVELRFFAGLTGQEIASRLDLSRQTVTRELTAARAWLLREMDRGRP